MNKIEELKQEIRNQREINIKLYKSIPVPSHEDPKNEKAEPILAEWRKGSKRLKALIKELNELERKAAVKTGSKDHKFINGFGEATTREITCTSYKNTESRISKQIMAFIS